MKINWPGAARIQFRKGNHQFYNGAKAENLKKVHQYGSKTYQKKQSCYIWGEGGLFSIFVLIWPIFWKKFMIQDFGDYNGAYCSLQNLKSLISPKILAKLIKARKHTLQNLAILLLFVCFGLTLMYFLVNKSFSRFPAFAPLQNS